MSTDDALQLALQTLSTILAQDLKPSEVEVGIVGGPRARAYVDGDDMSGEAQKQARFRTLSEDEINAVLEAIAERD